MKTAAARSELAATKLLQEDMEAMIANLQQVICTLCCRCRPTVRKFFLVFEGIGTCRDLVAATGDCYMHAYFDLGEQQLLHACVQLGENFSCRQAARVRNGSAHYSSRKR